MSEIDYQQPVPIVTLPEPSLKDIKDIEQTLKENLRNIMVKDSLIKQITDQVRFVECLMIIYVDRTLSAISLPCLKLVKI